MKTKPDRTVGIIARADLADSEQNLSALQQFAQGVPENLAEAEDHVRDAADSVRALDSMQGAEGLPTRYRPVLREAMEALRKEELFREAKMGEASDALRDMQGRQDIAEWRALNMDVRAHGLQLARVRAALQLAERLQMRRIPWGRIARRIMFGQTGTLGGFVREGAAHAYNRLRSLADYAQQAAVFAIISEVRKAADVAEDYEEGLGAFAVGHGMTDPGRGNAWTDAPWVTGDDRVLVGDEYQVGLGGIGRLRSAMMAMRQGFLATGAEALSTFGGLGDRYTKTRAIAAMQFARRTGEDPGNVAARYGRTLMYAHESVTGFLPEQREPAPEVHFEVPERTHMGLGAGDGGTGSTFALGEGLVTKTRTMSLQQLIGDAAVDAGEGARVPLFAERVSDYAEDMGRRAGMTDAVAPVGLARWSAQAGLFGRPEIVRGMLAGTANIGSDTMLAAKLAAVRRFMPSQVGIGGGSYAQVLRPGNFRQARTLIESGDPQVILAFAKYAGAAAAENGLGEDGRSLIFERLTGLGPMAASRVLAHVEQLADVRAVSPEKGLTDRWVEGPMYRGVSGGSWDSVARVRSERDAMGHELGLQVLQVTWNMREAMFVLRDGIKEGKPFTDAIAEAVGSLSETSVAWLTASQAANGKVGTAGATGVTWASQQAGKPGNDWGAFKASIGSLFGGPEPRQPWEQERIEQSPGPSGLINPVPGARLGDDLGAPRRRNGTVVHHHGLDLFADVGTPVQAAAAGQVYLARDRSTWETANTSSSRSAGITVWLNHADGTQTRYMHLDQIAINPRTGAPFRQGDTVTQGQDIGTVGTTGIHNSRSHLHFEVRGQYDQGQRPVISPRAALGIE